MLTYLWFVCGLLYEYACVCVVLPHQHHHHQLVQTLDFPPFVFALPFAGANFLDCLGIGIGISLVLFFSTSLLSLYVMRCHLSLFSFFRPPLPHTLLWRLMTVIFDISRALISCHLFLFLLTVFSFPFLGLGVKVNIRFA